MRVARPRDARQTAALLQAFGEVAVPDGLGGYEHNAAIHPNPNHDVRKWIDFTRVNCA